MWAAARRAGSFMPPALPRYERRGRLRVKLRACAVYRICGRFQIRGAKVVRGYSLVEDAQGSLYSPGVGIGLPKHAVGIWLFEAPKLLQQRDNMTVGALRIHLDVHR